MFPRGLPGFALLILRVSVAAALLLEHYAHRDALATWNWVAAILLSAVLSMGYLTPIAAALGLVLHMLIWFGPGGGSAAIVLVVSLDAIALALLGPGAYSLDGYRFGRRVLVLPAQ